MFICICSPYFYFSTSLVDYPHSLVMSQCFPCFCCLYLYFSTSTSFWYFCLDVCPNVPLYMLLLSLVLYILFKLSSFFSCVPMISVYMFPRSLLLYLYLSIPFVLILMPLGMYQWFLCLLSFFLSFFVSMYVCVYQWRDILSNVFFISVTFSSSSLSLLPLTAVALICEQNGGKNLNDFSLHRWRKLSLDFLIKLQPSHSLPSSRAALNHESIVFHHLKSEYWTSRCSCCCCCCCCCSYGGWCYLVRLYTGNLSTDVRWLKWS